MLVIRPRLVVSFGGYLSVPVVLSARLLGVTCVTHEQTTRVGLANRFIGRFCQKIFVSFSSSVKYFPKNKTVLVGNLLRREIFEDRGYFKFNNQKKTIYVTGGKQGAHKINELIGLFLPKLLFQYNLIHQCGSFSLHDDFSALQDLAEGLDESLRRDYLLQKHFNFDEIGSVLARANFVVSRAGANIVCELAALRKPSLLIPLEGSSHGEQEENAKLLSSVGLAFVIEESQMNEENLINGLKRLESLSPNEQKIDSEFVPNGDKKMAAEVYHLIS